MGRSDANPLNVPEPPRKTSEDVSHELAEMLEKSSLMFNKRPKENNETVIDSSSENEFKESLPEMTFCPQCNARLSSLDLKLNRCFRCRTNLETATILCPERNEKKREQNI